MYDSKISRGQPGDGHTGDEPTGNENWGIIERVNVLAYCEPRRDIQQIPVFIFQGDERGCSLQTQRAQSA